MLHRWRHIIVTDGEIDCIQNRNRRLRRIGRLKPLRKFSLSIHLWLGLFAALFLFVEGLTGGIMAWGAEILRLLNPPELQADKQIDRLPSTAMPRLSLEALAAALEAGHPGLRLRAIEFPQQPDLAWAAILQGSRVSSTRVWFDPRTGQEVGSDVPASRVRWLEMLMQISSRLHNDVVAGFFLLLLAFTGLILWWPRKILVLRGRPFSARTNFELHNAIGFYSSLILIVFASTSMILLYSRPATRVIARISHTPAPPPVPRLASFPPLARGASPLDLEGSMKAATRFLPPDARFTEMSRMNNGVLYFFYQPSSGTYDLQASFSSIPRPARFSSWKFHEISPSRKESCASGCFRFTPAIF